MKKIRCNLYESNIFKGVWFCGITDTEAIIDAQKKSEWYGHTKAAALNRANKELNPIGYMVTCKEV